MRADTADGLSGLMARLQQGVCRAAQRSRPADWEFRDEIAMANQWPTGTFAPLAGIRDVPWTDPDGPGHAIAAVTTALRDAPSLLATVLYSPATVLAQLVACFSRPGRSGDPGLADAWIALCLTAEGAWRAVTEGLPPEAGYGAGDTDLLYPLAARLRFLVLSEPMRWRGRPQAWWAWEPDQVFGGSGVLDRALGERSWGLVVGRCQESRRTWQRYLDAYQSHPLLSQASPGELEAELRALVFREQVRRAPLVLSVRPLAEQASPTAEDRALGEETLERHLLPRFDVAGATILGLFDDSRRGRRLRTTVAAAAALTGLAAVACAAALAIRPAAACYLLIGVGVVGYGVAWAAPWLLRLPAAAAVGIIALVSILPGGLLDTPPGGWLAALALTAAACGYLVVQARNHGVAGRSLWRALASPQLPARCRGARTCYRLVPGGRRVLADPVGRPADHGAAGPSELEVRTMKETEFAARLARQRAIESGQQEYEGGSGREYALRYYLAEMLDEVVRQATARSDLRAAPVPLLISLVGFSPVTTILSYELLRPQRLLVVTSADAEESVDVIADYVVSAGRLRHRDFMHRWCNPTDPHGIYRAVKAELEGLPTVAGELGQAVIDITGGRKVMSAAAALAAWQLNLRLCYIETDWDPARRQAIPGSDRLLLLDNPTTIFGEQGMEEALQLFAGGAFEAARRRYASLCDSLADPRRARFMRALSEFYRAWCDLDLAGITECAGAVEAALGQIGTEVSHETADRVGGQLEFVRRLARDSERDSFLVCFYVLGEHYRELARYDFAALLYYRTIEGGLARRLEGRAEGFSCERPDYSLLTSDVGALLRSYRTVLEHSGHKDPNPGLPPYVGLMNAAYLLDALGDEFTVHCHIKGTKALSHLSRLATTRNRSVLAHGEQAVRQADCEELGRKARLVLRAYWDDGGRLPVDELVSSLRFIRTDR